MLFGMGGDIEAWLPTEWGRKSRRVLALVISFDVASVGAAGLIGSPIMSFYFRICIRM